MEMVCKRQMQQGNCFLRTEFSGKYIWRRKFDLHSTLHKLNRCYDTTSVLIDKPHSITGILQSKLILHYI